MSARSLLLVLLSGMWLRGKGAVFLPDQSMKKKKTDVAAQGPRDARRLGGSTDSQADAAKHGESPPLRNKPSVRSWWQLSELVKTKDLASTFCFFVLILASATMRAADRRRAAAAVLFLVGLLGSGADAKTSPEGAATEGKSALTR